MQILDLNRLYESNFDKMKRGDITSFGQRSDLDKNRAIEKVINIFNNIKDGYMETTIVPPNILEELWTIHTTKSGLSKNHPNINISEAFDGGSHFFFGEKVKNFNKNPCDSVKSLI